jgi:hypothetical protein
MKLCVDRDRAAHDATFRKMTHICIRTWPKAALTVMTALFMLASVAGGEEMPEYPPVTRGWQAAQALLASMAAVYGVRPPMLRVDHGSSYSSGIIYMGDRALDSKVMEAVLAHEFVHYLFGHRGFLSANEEAADAKVVEVLQRARGYSRGEAFLVQLRRMRGIYSTNLQMKGHDSPCRELRIFLTGFPEFRDFVRETGDERERPCLPAGW